MSQRAPVLAWWLARTRARPPERDAEIGVDFLRGRGLVRSVSNAEISVFASSRLRAAFSPSASGAPSECCRASIDQHERFVSVVRQLDVGVQRLAAGGDECLFADPHVRLEAQLLFRFFGGPPEAGRVSTEVDAMVIRECLDQVPREEIVGNRRPRADRRHGSTGIP